MSDIINDIIIESPMFQEIRLEARKECAQDFLLKIIKNRFGKVEKSIKNKVKTLSKQIS